MKRDSLDEALRRKLHDAEAGLPVPPWAEMQRRMQLHANAHPAERVPLFRSWSRYAAAAVVLLGIGLGVWRVQRTHSWGEKSMAETVALPLPVSGSDSASGTAPAFNDTALNRIMKSARSVRLIDPRSKASTALLASLSDGAGAPSGNSSPSRDNTDNASATGSDMSSEPDRSAETAPNRELIAAYERKFAQTDAPLKRRGGRSKGWSASLYANASTFSNALSASGSSPMLLIQNAGLADIGSMRVESPVFEDSHMDHKFPVSVGFSVHKYLTPRLHIGTGLVYTYMSSKAEIEGAFNYRYRQRLHYLGIPLTVNYSVFDRGRFRHLFLGRSDGRVRLVCARDDRTVQGPGFRFVRDSQDRGRRRFVVGQSGFGRRFRSGGSFRYLCGTGGQLLFREQAPACILSDAKSLERQSGRGIPL